MSRKNHPELGDREKLALPWVSPDELIKQLGRLSFRDQNKNGSFRINLRAIPLLVFYSQQSGWQFLSVAYRDGQPRVDFSAASQSAVEQSIYPIDAWLIHDIQNHLSMQLLFQGMNQPAKEALPELMRLFNLHFIYDLARDIHPGVYYLDFAPQRITPQRLDAMLSERDIPAIKPKRKEEKAPLSAEELRQIFEKRLIQLPELTETDARFGAMKWKFDPTHFHLEGYCAVCLYIADQSKSPALLIANPPVNGIALGYHDKVMSSYGENNVQYPPKSIHRFYLFLLNGQRYLAGPDIHEIITQPNVLNKFCQTYRIVGIFDTSLSVEASRLSLKPQFLSWGEMTAPSIRMEDVANHDVSAKLYTPEQQKIIDAAIAAGYSPQKISELMEKFSGVHPKLRRQHEGD